MGLFGSKKDTEDLLYNAKRYNITYQTDNDNNVYVYHGTSEDSYNKISAIKAGSFQVMIESSK